MTPASLPRRGASRLAAIVFAVAVVALLLAVFAYRGTRPKPAGNGTAASASGEALRVGALPVT